jgi:alkylmercury lyase
MTAEKTTPSLDATDAALAAATPGLDDDGRRLAAAVLRLLSAGEPVLIGAAAAAARMRISQAEPVLRSWPAVFWDDHGRVTGFWGLALARMPHRIRHAGVDLYAWCAWDPLFLAYVIGDLQVTTADPVTGEAITYRIGPCGAITCASHPGSVLSFLRPDRPWDDDVMTSFCHYVSHFTGPANAERWSAAHPGTFVISLGEAAELARRHTARTFGAAPG